MSSKKQKRKLPKVEINAIRAKELQKEIVAAHESHALIKRACMEAEKERISITAEREAIAREAFAANLKKVKEKIEKAKKQESDACSSLE